MIIIVLKFLLIAVVAILQVGDWLTTRRVISQGGHEANPVMVRLIALLGFNAAFAVKGLVIVALVVLLTLRQTFAQSLIGVSLIGALSIWVVWHNWRQIK